MSNSYRCAKRCGHVSFCDGQNLYVWGGYVVEADGGEHMPTNEVWIYYENFDVWLCQTCQGEIPEGTSGACCAVVMPYAYVICGHRNQGHDNAVYRLHLKDFVWQEVDIAGENISPRDKFSAWVYENKIYCFGGYGPDPHYTGLNQSGKHVIDESENVNPFSIYGWNNQLLIFDTSTLCWSNPKCESLDTVPLPRAAHATVLLGDKVYLFGGRHRQHRMNDLHCLNLKTLTWSGQIMPVGPQPIGRSWHTLTAVSDDKFFLYGGFTESERVLDDAWIFTVSTCQWTLVMENTHKPRLWHTAVVTNFSNILIFGGCQGNIQTHNLSLQEFSDKIIRFQFQPSSLTLICLKYVSNHFQECDWQSQPLILQEWLNTSHRLQAAWLSTTEAFRAKMGPHTVNGLSISDGSGDPGS